MFDKKKGKGVFIDSEGVKQEGDAVDDKIKGKRTSNGQNGESCAGDFLEGEKGGKKVLSNPVGIKQEGDVVEDKTTGKGSSTSQNGKACTGNSLEGEMIDKGVDTIKNQNKMKAAESEKSYGNEAYKQKDFATALTHYSNAIEFDPKNLLYRSNKAAVFIETKDYPSVYALMQQGKHIFSQTKSEQRNPVHLAKLIGRWGRAKWLQGDLPFAERIYREALQEAEEAGLRKDLDNLSKLNKIVIKGTTANMKKKKGNPRFAMTFTKKGNMRQWNLKRNVLIKDWGRVFNGTLLQVAMKSNQTDFFAFCKEGQNVRLKKFSTIDKKLVDCGKAFDSKVFTLLITPDDKHLFAGDQDGYFKQWSLENEKVKLSKHHENMDMCGVIIASVCTKDSKYFYGGTEFGRLYKLSPARKEIVTYYGYICKGIDSMVITPDQKFLLIGSSNKQGEVDNGKLLQYNLVNDTLVKDYGIIFQNLMNTLTVTLDSKTVFMGCTDGKLKELSLVEKKVVKDYGPYHYAHMDMKATHDGKHLITASKDHSMKVFSIEKKKLVIT